MLWLALLRHTPDGMPSPAWPEALVWWALQFTPRVTRLEDGLLLELASSLRLFGGHAALQQRLLNELTELLGPGQATLAWAPNSGAALALARAGAPGDIVNSPSSGGPHALSLTALLDKLPFPVLSQADAHAPLLARLGLRTLGDVRQLPRAGLAKRTSPALLRQLDQAYGLSAATEAHAWCTAPEHFEARRELPQRTEHTEALLHHAEPLLRAACLWLGARQAGCTQIEFHWLHDSLRARDVGPGGQLLLASAEPHRELRVWLRLLAEHLQRLQLQAPVSDLYLRITHTEALAGTSASLLSPGDEAQRSDGESLHQLLTRLSVRLGPEHVRQASPHADHRPAHQQHWHPWQQLQPGPHGRSASAVPAMSIPDDPAQWPQPSWLLNPPLPLACLREQPIYQGPLTLLAGPQRIETAWWDTPGTAARRDYYLAHGRQAGLLWLYRERQPQPGSWYLEGLFA